MSPEFDGLYIWLGIPESEQPADHYRLLGLQKRESNPAAIDNAFESRQSQVAAELSGDHAEAAQKLIGELNEAHRILTDPDLKRRYDEQFPPAEPEEDESSVAQVEPGRIRTAQQSRGLSPVVISLVVLFIAVGSVAYMYRPNGTEKEAAKNEPVKKKRTPTARPKHPRGRASGKSVVEPSKQDANKVTQPADQTHDVKPKISSQSTKSAVKVKQPQTIVTKKPAGKKKQVPRPAAKPVRVKKPIPVAGQQVRARKRIRMTFSAQFRQATTKTRQREVAQFLYEQAVTLEDDKTAQYVMFDEAIKMAVRAHSVRLVEKYTKDLSRSFTVDYFAQLAIYFKAMAKESLGVMGRALLSQAAIDATNAAMLQENLKPATELVRIAVSQSARIRDMSLRKQALSLRTSVRTRNRQWKEMQEAKATLAKTPNHPAANELVGRYRCLQQGDWQRGMTMLKSSKNKTLKSLAESDLAQPTTAAERQKLAMRWLRYSRSNKRNERFAVRAKYWFRQAIPQLRGLDRKVAEFEYKKLQAKFPHEENPNRTSTPRNATYRFARSLQGHTYWVSSIAFSADSKTIFSGGYDNKVRKWDVATGNSVVLGTGQTKQVTSVAVAARGSLLAIGGFDKKIHLWDSASNVSLGALVGHTSEIAALAVSPDGRWVVSGDADNAIRVWDVKMRKQRTSLAGHSGGVSTLAISPDGRWVVSGGRDQKVAIWDLQTGRLVTRLSGHGGTITAVAIAGSERVISAATDRQVIIWDVRLRAARMTIPAGPFAARSIAISKRGMLVAIGGQDRQLQVVDVTTGMVRARLGGHKETITSIAFSPDERFIATGSRDYTIRLWRLDDGNKTKLVQVAQGPNANMKGKAKPKPRPTQTNKKNSTRKPAVAKQKTKQQPKTTQVARVEKKKLQPVPVKQKAKTKPAKPAPLPVAQAALERIRSLGGRVFLTREQALRVSLARTKIQDSDLALFTRLQNANIVTLTLDGTQITGRGLAHIAKLKTLQSLGLNGTKIVDEDLATISGLSNLQTLRLYQTKLAGTGLVHLKKLTQLRSLTLPTDIKPSSLANLAPLKQLAFIQMPKNLDDESMKHVGQLTGLRSLHLSTARVTDRGIGHIVSLTRLQLLTLPPRVGDPGANAVAQLTNLKTLNIGNTQISDAGFAKLAKLSKLESLQVPRRVTSKSLAILQSYPLLRYLQLSASQIQGGALNHVNKQTKISTLIVNGSTPLDGELKRFPTVLPDLQILHFNGNCVGDQALQHLTKLKGLRNLSIHSARLGDSGTQWVAQLGKLQQLSLLGSKISDTGLQRLAALSQLRSLNLQRTAVTAGGVSKFRQSLPNCRIFH